MPVTDQVPEFLVFKTELGWTALRGSAKRLQAIAFGHDSRQAALGAVAAPRGVKVRSATWITRLAARLQAFLDGAHDEFEDVAVDFGPRTDFQTRVFERCRMIPYGETLSYGELARDAGYPGAARAAGSVMASNPMPLVVPCHRVVAANGLGGYSARQGLRVKRFLLALETARAPKRNELALTRGVHVARADSG